MGQGLYTKVAQVVAASSAFALDRVRITHHAPTRCPNTSATAASSRHRSQRQGGADWRRAPSGRAWRRSRPEARRARRRGRSSRTARCALGHGAPWRSPSWRDLAHARSASRSRRPASTARPASTRTRPRPGPPLLLLRLRRRGVARSRSTAHRREPRAARRHPPRRRRLAQPGVDRGQVEGGFVQGMGWLTSEELRWDDEGRLAHARALHLQDPGHRRRRRATSTSRCARRAATARTPSTAARPSASRRSCWPSRCSRRCATRSRRWASTGWRRGSTHRPHRSACCSPWRSCGRASRPSRRRAEATA